MQKNTIDLPVADAYLNVIVPGGSCMDRRDYGAKLAFSIAEAASSTSLGRSKIYKLIAEGKLEVRKVGKRTLIPAVSLQRLIDPAS